MTVESAPRRRGRTHKRDAVLEAARSVFARHGYTRTSIDAIAIAAEVSTRTIYNHFASKDELFNAVLLHSAGQVADNFIAQVGHLLAESAGPGPSGPEPGCARASEARAALDALGQAMVAHTADNREHFALVRQISAEAEHVPASVLEGWQEAGPLRVQAELMSRLTQLGERGLLDVPNPRRAALHFIALVQIEAGQFMSGGIPIPPPGELDRAEAVRAAVGAFLNGYRARGE